MPSSYFAGNKTNTGGALFVSFNSKEQAIYYRIIKQTGWDEKTSKPSFTGGTVINLKLSADEAGEVIHAVSGHTACKFYHQFNGEATSGSFSYWEKEYTDKSGKPAKSSGFGLSVRKGEVQAKIGLSLGASERLSQYLQFALDHIHSAIYAQDKKELEEYLKKRDADKVASTPTPTRKAAPKTQQVPDDVDPIPDPSDSAPPELVVEGGTDPLEW